MHMANGAWDAVSALIGTVRIRVTPLGGSGPAFIGIAQAGAADRYLTAVNYATVVGTSDSHETYVEHAGSAPPVPPVLAGIWVASEPPTLTPRRQPGRGDRGR
jgi:hypothetical protein